MKVVLPLPGDGQFPSKSGKEGVADHTAEPGRVLEALKTKA